MTSSFPAPRLELGPPASALEVLLDAQRAALELIQAGRPVTEVLNALCHIAEAQLGPQARAAVLLRDGAQPRLRVAAAPSLPDAFFQALDGVEVRSLAEAGTTAVATRSVVETSDLQHSGAEHAVCAVLRELALESAWASPVLTPHGEALGSLCVYFAEPRLLLSHERRVLALLTQLAALALSNDNAERLGREQRARNNFLSALGVATQPLIEPAELMGTVARMLAEFLDVERCAYAEVENEQVFVITGDYARNVPSIVGRWPVAAFGPRCERDMLSGAPYVSEDVERDPDVGEEHLPAYRAAEIRAVICVPLHKNGKFTAAMAVHQAQPRAWSRQELELVRLVVGRCWEALERARITRTLLASEARYRTIVEASSDCVKLISADGILQQINPAGVRMLEAATHLDVVGHSVDEWIAPEHRERFRAFNQQVCSGRGGTLEIEILGNLGTRRMLEITAVPLPMGVGFAQLASARDVTARVAADHALRESRSRLDYAVRLSGVGFWYCDLPFDELIWDARVKEHFFLAPDARVTIDTFYERIHPEDREATRQAIDRSVEERSQYDVMYRTVDASSSAYKWIRALGGTTYRADGQPIRFDGVTVDVTAQRRDQERLARALERERHQASLLKKVADAALAIHGASSVDAVLRVVGEEARRILRAAEVETELVHELAGTTQVQESQPHRVGSESLSILLTGPHGAKLGWVRLSRKQDGEFTETDEAVLMQLAQVAAVALENARLYDQLRDHDRRKDEFLATLAHELRNPLAPLRTGVHVLRLDGANAAASKAIEMMERQLAHMVRMVDDLLDVSRITLGKVTLKRERFDFHTAVRSALESTRTLIETSGHQVSLQLPSEPLMLDADPTRMAQVVANLVNNAAKYTTEPGVITLSAGAEGSMLTFRVSDTGVGIPADMLPRVFDMFTQVGSSLERSQGGLGIGLTLVRRLVEMHGGRVTAESAGAGRGSTFSVRLPLASEPLSREEQAPLPRASSVAPARRLRVLVVDDNEDAAETMSMLLARLGHDTATAHDGFDGLAQITAFRPDLVFLDIGLPGLNGYQVAERVRADAALRQPVLVALTGWGSEEDRRQALRAGIDRHLVKPVDPAAVRDLLLQVEPSRG